MVRLPISRVCVGMISRPSSLVRRYLSDSKLVQSARTAPTQQEIRINSKQMYTEQPMKILNSKGYTLLILNGDHTNPDALSRDNFNRFWTQSMYRVAVDGGLNVLNDFDKGSPSVFIPHTVIGDLDSADEDLIEEYGHYGVEIINRDDQDSTDLAKAIELVIERINEDHLPSDQPIIIFGSSKCSRMDHLFGQYHSLLQFSNSNPNIPIYLIQDASLSRVLRPGHHTLDMSTGYEGKYLGLIPLGEPANVITRGLKWDINGELKFGELVSTSNELVGPTLEVTTSSPIILTMQIDRPAKTGCCGGGCS